MSPPSPDQHVELQGYPDDILAPSLGYFSPLILLAWSPSDLKKEQIKVVESLKHEKHRLKEEGYGGEARGFEARISSINEELHAWEESRMMSAEMEPSWDVFTENQQRIKSLEAEILRLQVGKAPRDPPPDSTDRVRELEKTWLEKSSCPNTADEWEQKVRAILSDVATCEADLEKARGDVSDYRANLDLEKVELQAYKARVEGGVASVAATANELLTMIRNVRHNLQDQKDHRGRGAKGAGSRVTPLEAMFAAERIFKPTHELAERIVVKVKSVRESMTGFWEEGEKSGDRTRRPWELVRAIKARDYKIVELEREVREFRERAAHFTRRMEKVQEAAGQIIAEEHQAGRNKALADEVAALMRVASGLAPAHNQQANGASIYGPRGDDTESISEDDYGNIIKMADKFDRVKSELQGQIGHFRQLAAGYRAARDQALKSVDESRDARQLLQDEIESIKAKCLPRVEEAVRNCEARHARELQECRREVREVQKELRRCKSELREKTAECEGLTDSAMGEEKRLLAYNMDRFAGEAAMNPVARKLMEQTEKEHKVLKDRIVELKDTLAALEARNETLEKALQSERERASRYLGTMDSAPALKRSLAEAERAAEEYQQALKDAKSRIETLQHDIQIEKNNVLDFESGEAEARRLVAALRSELEDQKEEAENRLAIIKKKLEIEVAKQSAKAAESRQEYMELRAQYGEPSSEIVEGKAAAIVPTLLLKSALSQRASLLEQLRSLREKHASILLDKSYAMRDAKESRDELTQTKQTEARLREEHATALIELQNLQGKLDRATAEVRVLRLRVEKQEEKQTDPGKIWDDTPIGMSKEVLQSRIKTLEENLVTALRVGGASGVLTDEAEGHHGPRVKNSRELFRAVRNINGPQKCSLTAADMTNFWHQGSLLNKKLALLRAIRDGNLARGYDSLNDLDKFLRETDLGTVSDEAWGSVQYLQACFHLYTAGDIVAAQAASRRAAEHHPESWSRKFYCHMGARLEANLQRARMVREASRAE